MRQIHPGGERLFVDYAGQTVPVVDATTGEIRRAQVFVAVLGASNYTYDLRTGVQKLKDATPDGVLLGSGKLAGELDRLDLIDEYKFLVHPRIAGHGPTLYESGLPATRRLELISARPLRSGAVAMHYRHTAG